MQTSAVSENGVLRTGGLFGRLASEHSTDVPSGKVPKCGQISGIQPCSRESRDVCVCDDGDFQGGNEGALKGTNLRGQT